MKYETDGIHGKLVDGVFVFPVRVYYEDTDAGGIVYYANYLKFAERARTEFIRFLGQNQVEQLDTEDKFGFVVRHCEVDYKKSARLDDLLSVTCEVVQIKGAVADICQHIYRNDEELAEVKVMAAYVNINKRKPCRIPVCLASKICKTEE